MEAQKIPLTELKLGDRQRKEYPEDQILKRADSIQRTHGLLHPIVIDPETGILTAGGCRTRAYGVLMMRAQADRAAGRYVPEDGWMNIPFVFKGNEGDTEEDRALFKEVCELEENVERLDLEWYERAAAIAKIDSIQKRRAESRGETWNMRKTAEMAGVSLGTVQQSVELVKEVEKNPDIKKEETLTGALRKVATKKQLAKRQEEMDQKQAGRILTFPAEIIVGDASELIDLEPDAEFDAIVTNFPFGVEYGYSGQASAVYKDDEDYIVDLVRTVVRKSYRVLKDDSWFFAFFDIRKATYSNPGMTFYTQAITLAQQALREKILTPVQFNDFVEVAHKSLGLVHWFEEAGFKYVRAMPLIWAKPNKTQGNIGDPRKGMIVAYEAAIIACKGDGVLLKQGRNDLFVYDTLNPSERDFEMQMPVALCKEICSLLTLGKGRILDPFAGVGSFGEGALENQCSFKGFELNPERAATGNLRLREHVFAKAGV